MYEHQSLWLFFRKRRQRAVFSSSQYVIFKYLAFVLAFSFSLYVHAKPQLSLKNQVYEFVFNEIMQDSITEINLISSYRYGKLEKLNLEEVLSQYNSLNKMPQHLLSDLLEAKSTASQLNWKPIMVKVNFIRMSEVTVLPESYYYVSDVAIDDASQEAVVLLGYHCPALCGANEMIIYLKKSGVQWHVLSAHKLWVS